MCDGVRLRGRRRGRDASRRGCTELGARTASARMTPHAAASRTAAWSISPGAGGRRGSCDGAECCKPHDGVGCDQLSCQECICGLDAACCIDVWDGRCAEQAMLECSSACLCLSPRTCCEARDEPGCGDFVCEACVCEIDGLCCSDLWDGNVPRHRIGPGGCEAEGPCNEGM